MDRMIVAVFDPPTRAVDGQYALRRLDDACSIALYASALIDKAAVPPPVPTAMLPAPRLSTPSLLMATVPVPPAGPAN